MNARCLEFAHPASVTEVENVSCRNPANCSLNQSDELPVFRNARDVRLRIVEGGHFRRNELREAHGLAELLILRTLRFLQFAS